MSAKRPGGDASALDRSVRPAIPGAIRRVFSRVDTDSLSLVIALVILVIVIASQTDKFFLPRNLLNIGQNVSVLGLVAVGETIVILAGALDISVGSIAGVASVMAAIALQHTPLAAGGVGAGLVIGLAFGIANGLVVTVLRVNPVIATLATFAAFRGIAFLLAPGGKPVGVSNEGFINIGDGRIFDTDTFPGIPVSLLVLIGVAAAVEVMLRYTDFGRTIYAMGGNPAAARLAGISLNRMKIAIYGISGLLAGLAGVVVTARVTAGEPASGTQGLELQAITAVLLGGAALTGGKGSVIATMLAVLLVGTLTDGMNLLGVQSFYQDVAQGLLLILAVAIGQYRVARAERARTRRA